MVWAVYCFTFLESLSPWWVLPSTSIWTLCFHLSVLLCYCINQEDFTVCVGTNCVPADHLRHNQSWLDWLRAVGWKEPSSAAVDTSLMGRSWAAVLVKVLWDSPYCSVRGILKVFLCLFERPNWENLSVRASLLDISILRFVPVECRPVSILLPCFV